MPTLKLAKVTLILVKIIHWNYVLCWAIGLAGCSSSHVPITSSAIPQALEAKLVDNNNDPICKNQLTSEFRQGRYLSTDCQFEREALAKSLLRQVRPQPIFGVVEQQHANAWGEKLILAHAHRCQRWVLRNHKQAIITPAEAEQAKCSLRRYYGPLVIHGIDLQGAVISAIYTAQVDRDGKVEIYYADLDTALIRRGFAGLHALDSLYFGEQGWAGSIKLANLRNLRADTYYQWIKQGRGTPGLFLTRYPKHARANLVQSWIFTDIHK